MNKVCAIILAAGKGTRMGTKVQKQFLNIKEKPILYYTLKVFSECSIIDEIILVTGKDEIDYCRKEIVDKFRFDKINKIVAGAAERQDSVFNGLLAAENCQVAVIHDGARPFVDERIIKDGVEYALRYKASSCGVSPKDTIKVKDEFGFSKDTPNRDILFSVQTPQCFDYELIFDCHKKIRNDNIKVTDDTMVVERYGNKVFLYEGSYNNIKITTPEDLIIGERILEVIS